MAPNKYSDASQPQNSCGHPAGLLPTILPLASSFFRNLGLIRVGLTGAAALIADNLRVTYSVCPVVWVPVFCIGGGRIYY